MRHRHYLFWSGKISLPIILEKKSNFHGTINPIIAWSKTTSFWCQIYGRGNQHSLNFNNIANLHFKCEKIATLFLNLTKDFSSIMVLDHLIVQLQNSPLRDTVRSQARQLLIHFNLKSISAKINPRALLSFCSYFILHRKNTGKGFSFPFILYYTCIKRPYLCQNKCKKTLHWSRRTSCFHTLCMDKLMSNR